FWDRASSPPPKRILLRHGLLHSSCQTRGWNQCSLAFIFKRLEMTICDTVKALSKFFSPWAGKSTRKGILDIDLFVLIPNPEKQWRYHYDLRNCLAVATTIRVLELPFPVTRAVPAKVRLNRNQSKGRDVAC